MAKRRLDKYKSVVALGVFLVAWWVLPIGVKAFLKASFTEFQAPAWVASSYLDDLEGFWARRMHSKRELEIAGQEIARAKSYYQFNAQRAETLQAEIRRLESILDLPSRREYRYEVARVIRRDLNAWWQQLILRKGRDYDIPKGAAVVFAGGVVGRIVEVNAFTSRVELISSPNFRMAAQFEGNPRPVVYEGLPHSGFGDPVGRVSDAPQDLLATTKEPLRLVSTHLGGTFPPGLAIGKVAWLEPAGTGIFQTGEVMLDRDLLSLHEVAVLIPLNPIEIDSHAP